MKIILIAALLAACGSGERSPPPADQAPRVDSIVVDSTEARGWPIFRHASFGVVAPGDSSTYKVRYRLSSLATGDTVQIRLVRDSVAGKVKRVSLSRNRFTAVDSASFVVDKIYGTQAKYSSCVIKRKNTVLSSMCQDWITNFPARVTDTMSVDSSLALAKLDIKPDTIRLNASKKTDGTPNTVGITQQFCALVVFKDGKVALRAQEAAKPECVAEHRKFSLAKRSVTPTQQLIADRTCVKWTATGGTIGAEVCSTPSPLTNS